MPKLTVDGKTAEVPDGQRLVLAIESQGINIGHRCGGFARCTTCRVEVHSGEPDTMTRAEFEILRTRDLLGKARLSCQIVCDHDISVTPLLTKENQNWDSTGPAPEPTVTPAAEWFPKSQLEQEAAQQQS